MTEPPYVGQRVSYGGACCTIRYIGEVAGTSGSWLGVEWDGATRGKHDGSHKGQRYFTCLSRSATAASFIRPTRPRDESQGFLSALKEKYLSESPEAPGSEADSKIIISGKVAEEVGFDKIWKKLAQVKDLKIVILDGLRMSVASQPGDESLATSCPSIVHLDLGRNLFETLGPVVDICGELSNLRKLSLHGNRFQNVLHDESVSRTSWSFRNIEELSVDQTLLTWEELCYVAARCPNLTALNAGSNQFLSLSLTGVSYGSLSCTLTSLNLEFNEFTALSDLSSLASLESLRNLHLKGNNISAVSKNGALVSIFPPSLHYLDVSYNNISGWEFVDALPTHVPGLTGLRLSHNPIYDTQDAEKKAASSEESHMFTVARLATLKSLNFAHIKPADRTNAEMFYLSRIAKQLATVPEGAEDTVIAQHPRYKELCEIYGEPDVIRRDEINPSFLEARLITVAFHVEGKESKTSRIPKSFDIYAVKGIAGRAFNLSPLRLRLIWETGEWDPVAGYDEHDDEGGDEEDMADEARDAGEIHPSDDNKQNEKSGRWIKREVELKDGPRQLGYCVDGLDVSIRIEMISNKA